MVRVAQRNSPRDAHGELWYPRAGVSRMVAWGRTRQEVGQNTLWGLPLAPGVLAGEGT
jgi:hypothetical protein